MIKLVIADHLDSLETVETVLVRTALYYEGSNFNRPHLSGMVQTHIYDFWSHNCFSRLVKSEATTMENGFQVTILDSKAPES